MSLALSMALAAAEIGARLVTTVDGDGTVSIGSAKIGPLRLPVRRTEQKVETFLGWADPRIIYDADLGWVPRPHARSADGMYVYDSSAIRSADPAVDYASQAGPRIRRVGLFGDSFTHGDEVFFEHSWGAVLERSLAGHDRVQVLNFGVPGYGMDQAYLRWQIDGRKFALDVVIFGLHGENMRRNLNILRPLLYPDTGLPFSKPRLVVDDGELILVNRPAIHPSKLADTISNLCSWSLQQYEYFAWRYDCRAPSWSSSRLLYLLAHATGHQSGGSKLRSNFYDFDAEPTQLSLAIVATFAGEVADTGATFIVVHLPNRDHLRHLRAGRTLPYADLLEELQRRHQVVDVSEHMTDGTSPLEDLYLTNGHYTPKGNRIVADALAARVRAALAGP